jgi:hypothetical protein
LKDDSWVQGEAFGALKLKLEGVDQDLKKKLDTIKREQLNWASNDYDDGFNVDNEVSDEEIGQRFTRL